MVTEDHAKYSNITKIFEFVCLFLQSLACFYVFTVIKYNSVTPVVSLRWRISVTTLQIDL